MDARIYLLYIIVEFVGVGVGVAVGVLVGVFLGWLLPSGGSRYTWCCSIGCLRALPLAP